MSLWLVGGTAAVVAAAGVAAWVREREPTRPSGSPLSELAINDGAIAAVRFSVADAEPERVGRVPDVLASAVSGDDTTSALAGAIDALRREGVPFRLALNGGADGSLDGRLRGGVPVVLVHPARPDAALNSLDQRLRELVEHIPHPVWLAAPEGDCLWTNRAYDAVVGHREWGDGDRLLDANAAQKLAQSPGAAVSERVQTVVGETRRQLDVTEHRGAGMARFALDVTDAVEKEVSFTRQLQSHSDTLDRLTTAVAIYSQDRRLVFYNAAFRALWEQPAAFLDEEPAEDRVLDRLRAEGRLPETSDHDVWKAEAVRIADGREPSERWWHLPDGQTLRVIANPGSDGGVTYIYENVTEQLALERRFNALSRVQAETIDGLGEGIATFGPNGLLRLSNPAFWALTGLSQAEVGVHVRILALTAAPETQGMWRDLTEMVTDLSDRRLSKTGRVERDDGTVVDFVFSPLPDGATLAALVDVTDTVNVARALEERNVALEEGDRLKSAFVGHVSYELRSPLNAIIGFNQMLTKPYTGALNEKQREYVSDVSASSEALLTIIDGILDLATIDAGIMELSHEPVYVAAAVQEVLAGLKDRIAKAKLEVIIDVAPNAAVFEGDVKRVRQVLFNLVSNAVSHSPEGGEILISTALDDDAVLVSVRDHGPGISDERAQSVFERFTTAGTGGRRGGVGLGLTLVKSFVELHGGTVAVGRPDGAGAELLVRFPKVARGTQSAAA
ncbi:MAG: ATP-binding protein [Pseudomonadota bacterium]